MIIGTKRREEVLDRATFKYKSVMIDHGDSATVVTFPSKKSARAFPKQHAKFNPHDRCYVDTTGWPTQQDAVMHWVRFCQHDLQRKDWKQRGMSTLIDNIA